MTATINRLSAYRAEAAMCRAKAKVDIRRQDYWHAEARKWDDRAKTESDVFAVAYQKPGRSVPRPD